MSLVCCIKIPSLSAVLMLTTKDQFSERPKYVCHHQKYVICSHNSHLYSQNGVSLETIW